MYVQVLGSGLPCWELLRALRLASVTPPERRLHGHRAAAGQAISTHSDVRWDQWMRDYRAIAESES